MVRTVLLSMLMFSIYACKPSGKLTFRQQRYLSEVFDSAQNFERKWLDYPLLGSQIMQILDHRPATMQCNGGIKTYSISIGTLQNGDTIRVLELFNTTKIFQDGASVTVNFIPKPKDQYTHPGVFVQGNYGQLRPANFDILVLKTAYGILTEK